MALLAKERRSCLKQAFSDRSVRVVAVAAVLIDGLVTMNKRAALFHMTGVAGVDHAVALHQAWAGRAMYVMAIRTSDLAFKNWMVRGFVNLGALLLVAGKAHLRLR